MVLLICQGRDASVFGSLAPEPEIQVMDGGLSRMQFSIQLFLPKEMVEGKLKEMNVSLFGLLDESKKRAEPVFDLVNGAVPCIPVAPDTVVPVSELGMDESSSEEEEGGGGRVSIS